MVSFRCRAGIFFLCILLWAVISCSGRSPARGAPQAASYSSQFDGPAELPRFHVNSSLASSPAPGSAVLVRDSAGFQEALNGAGCGETIQLQAGVTFAGYFTFPEKPCDDSHWIVVRTSARDDELPADGTRLTPCFAGVQSLPGRPDFHCKSVHNVLAKLEFDGRTGSGPLIFRPGANHYRLIGLEVTRGMQGASISKLGFVKGESEGQEEGGGTAHHLIFDRMWFHGTAQDETTVGLSLVNTTEVAVIDSFFTDFHCVAITGACTDAQALGTTGGHSPGGPYKIENNFLEASGENILFGGGGATRTPSDIEIRRNYLFKPMIWKPGAPGFVGGLSGHPFIVKNHFELKNAQRVLFEQNLLENVWGGFSQAGFSILLTPKNQNNHCPSCLVSDVTIRYNKVKNIGDVLQIANVASDAGGASQGGGRYSIHDLLVEDLHHNDFEGFGLFALISSVVPPLHDVRIEHVTAFVPVAVLSIMNPGERLSNFSIMNNIFAPGSRQIASAGGGPRNCAHGADVIGPAGVLKSCFAGSSFTHNLIIGGSDWPPGNVNAKDPGAAGIREIREPGAAPYALCRARDDSVRCKKASPALGTATDGRDLGADVVKIEKALTGVS
jgi:hypothetical protein